MPGRDVVWLEVPADAPDAAKTRFAERQNYGFAVNTMHIVANKRFAEANPAAAKLFSIVKLPLNDINVQNGLMNKGQNKAGGRGTSCRRLAQGPRGAGERLAGSGARRRHVMKGGTSPFCAKKNARQLPGVL